MTITHPFDKVLIANRGEIARRVMRALREMGLSSVAVYSDADAGAPHVADADQAVRIGGAPSGESYLNIERIIEAATRVGAGAIHPGYGFLSENAAFAQACADAGIVFIGPSVDVIRRMGSKIEAKKIAQDAGIPVLPGFSAVGMSDDEVAASAVEIGYPLLVKASGGGGGRGMRIVRDANVLAAALASARREASAAFGDDRLLIERYLEGSRHIEVQIFGDSQGQVVHCFERECSIQRRHQKVIEEAPSPGLDPVVRGRMLEAAVGLGKAIGYQGAGTVELILDRGGDFYFLEVNTRLQVEHPVTELITGLDLVRMQIEVAQGLPLAVSQADISVCGHAIEARLYAEDPHQDFLPMTGRVAMWSVPELPGLRVDSGIEQGSEVSVHYDPMLAKVIAHGDTRLSAQRRLLRGLSRLSVGGLTTNRDFLRAAVAHPAFVAGQLDTAFIETHMPPDARRPAQDVAARRGHLLAALVHEVLSRHAAGGPLPVGIPIGFRNNRSQRQHSAYATGDGEVTLRYLIAPGGRFDVAIETAGGDRTEHRVVLLDWVGGMLDLEIDGVRTAFRVVREGDRVSVHGGDACSDLSVVARFVLSGSEQIAGACVAPMTGVVGKVYVAVGDRVERGTVLVMLEAMKMEHELSAQGPGTVRAVHVEAGQMVDPDEVLVVVEPLNEDQGDTDDD